MQTTQRRDFLKGSLAAAGWTALSTGAVGAFLSTGCTRGAERSRFLTAVIDGDLAAVRGLLDQEPDLLQARDDAGRSAFALAALHFHGEVRDLLRERGYEPDLHESALVQDWERFEALAEASPDLVNRDHALGGTAMHVIALAGTGMAGFRVYTYGGDPNLNLRGNDGYSPVRTALDYPELAAAEMTAAFLLGNGADPNAPQARGSSALHAAAARGSVPIVEILIRKGATIDALDEAAATPLQLADEKGHRGVVELLEHHQRIPRDHSTSRDRYDVDGAPYRRPDLSAFPLMDRGKLVGASHFDLDTVRETVERRPLLAHSVAATTERAVEACAHTGQRPIVDYLIGKGAAYSLPTAVMRNDLRRARELLKEDPLRVHERGPHDFALLWYPVIGRGLTEMAELLFEYGAEVEHQHWMGTTALHYAALGGQTEMIALLLEHGADVNRIGRKFDGRGQTALRLAESRDHADTVKLLRERGARG